MTQELLPLPRVALRDSLGRSAIGRPYKRIAPPHMDPRAPWALVAGAGFYISP